MILIAAVDQKNGIGLNGKIPWKSKEDMKFFREMTQENIVIMGRKTWESIGRALPNRINIVLSKTNIRNVISVANIEQLKNVLKSHPNLKKFVIGGSQIYDLFLTNNMITEMYITYIESDYNCDTYFPQYNKDDWKKVSEKAISLSPITIVKKYEKINKEEIQFLNIIEKVLTKGIKRTDRTGIGTLSIFCEQLRFSLEDGRFPLMTHRKVPLRMIFEELMWMLRGQTDAKILDKKRVPIWNPNSTKEFLKKRRLNYEEGDIGAAYGFQLRNFGAKYEGCHKDYKGGVDQLKYVINLLNYNPNSRRILFTYWNPADLDKMALPPCAFNYQFYVANKWLSCRLVQRSSDIALAGGWNIATASLLTYMLAHVCGLRPKEIIWCPADIHIYLNQIDAAREIIKRTPNSFPIISLYPPRDNDITKYEWSDINLKNYEPLKKINISMNA